MKKEDQVFIYMNLKFIYQDETEFVELVEMPSTLGCNIHKSHTTDFVEDLRKLLKTYKNKPKKNAKDDV
ncbi:MAG: hypothetical protein NW226_17615 [Microscillaceae bacterium]|nr:hypothetical protein [Microscillaceae bacterium]